MRLIPDDIWATLTIWQEARNQPPEGQIAVGEVIWRRTQQHYMSDGTVAGTVLKALQFSGWNAGDPNRVTAAQLDDADPVVQHCAAAWAQAKSGSNYSKGALLYLNPDVLDRLPGWVKNCDEVAVIGAHHFYVPRR